MENHRGRYGLYPCDIRHWRSIGEIANGLDILRDAKPKELTDDEKRQFIKDFDAGVIPEIGSARIRRDHYEREFKEAEQRKERMVDIYNCFEGREYTRPNHDWRVK